MGSNGIGYLKNVLKPELYAYFKNYHDPANPTYTVTHYLLDDQGFPVDFIDFHVFDPDRPTSRGVMEDLHLALSYNNLTRGWNPEHPLYLYHSVYDKAVPVCNRSSAAYYFGKWGKIIDSAFSNDHVTTAIEFLLGYEEFDAIRDLSEADTHPAKETLGMAEPVVKGKLLVDGKDVVAEYVIRDGKAILGTGYNACMSQYLSGKVEVPGSITVEGKEYQVSAVNDMAFRLCSYITHVTLPEGVTRIGDLAFYGCLGLLEADLPSTLKTIGSGAFIDLPNLTTLILRAQTPPKWEYNDVFCFHSGGIGDASAYTTDNTILFVPEGCVHTYETTAFSNSSLGWTTASGWDYFTHIKSIADYAPEAYAVYDNGTLTFYYDGRIATRQGRVYRLNEGEHFPGWSDTSGGGYPTSSSDPEDHSKDITKVVFSLSFRYARPTSTFGWFFDCVNLTSIEGWENLNTSEVTHMNFMFANSSQLTSDDLDFSHFDTGKVEYFSFMFKGCKGLNTLDLSHFNTSKAEWFNNMFDECSNLTSLDISHFDTSEGAEFDCMFYGCSSLENIDLSNFYMLKAVHTGEMFFGCSSLKTLTIPTVISKVRDMFIGCTNMEHVYFYGAKPFDHWGIDRHMSFAPNEKTLFHVLYGTANAWKDAYQVEEEGVNWRANCTFVDDLGTDDNDILIYHEGDWANLQNIVDMGFTNISVKLMNDVSITSSIGTSEKPFSGIFDGNGHTLNTFILNYADAAGVFNNINGATIKNLHVTGDVLGNVCTGGIVGVARGDGNLIENCRVSANVGSMSNSTNGPHVGGIIGHGLTYTNTIRGCLFEGELCVLQDDELNDSYAGAFFGWCSDPSKQKVEDSMEKGSYDSRFQHKGLNYDERGKTSSVQVTNTYHFQSWKEGKRAYSITCESEAFRLNYGTPVTTYGVSGIDVYDDGITQDGTFYAGDLERVSMSIAGVEGYDFSINSFVAKDAYLLVDYQHPGNFIVGIAGSDVVIEVSSNLETFYIFDNERNSKRLLDIVGKFEGYDVRLSGRTLYRDGSWNTLCLPFDVSDITGTPLEGAQVKTLEGVEYEYRTLTLNFGKDLTSLEAGMPYIVRWERPESYVTYDGNNLETTSDLVNPLFTGVTITLSIPGYTWFDYNDDGIMDVGFRGLFNPMDIGGNHSMVYLGSDDKLYYSNGNMRVNACRAYFVLNGFFTNKIENGINNFVLNFDNGQTDISSSMVEGSGCSDETWYSMDGRKLNAKPKAKGVYVSHGKKIFIK